MCLSLDYTEQANQGQSIKKEGWGKEYFETKSFKVKKLDSFRKKLLYILFMSAIIYP